ncbi:EF-hand calcium-binding domain-containing protein 12-like [Glandiceps talaboti]
MTDIMEWSDFGLTRLFNPDNSDYLPIEEQIKLYKQRDLAKTKYFKTATKVWGTTRPRKRLIIAPPMEKMAERDVSVVSPPLRLRPLTTKKTEIADADRALSETEILRRHEEELERKRSGFKSWYDERRQLRESLERLGMSEDWLAGKPDKTPLEEKLYRKMMEDKMPKHEEPKRLRIQEYSDSALPDFSSEFSSLSESSKKCLSAGSKKAKHSVKEPTPPPTRIASPTIVKPPPEALATITKHLHDNRIRLIDLFARADKDKNWMITRVEFEHCINDAKIPLSSYLLEELMNSLDTDMNDQLDYRELVQGMKEFQIDERQRRRARMESTGTSSNFMRESDRTPRSRESPATRKSRGSPGRPLTRTPDKRVDSAASQRSVVSFAASDASEAPSLGIPKVDITEQITMATDDLMMKRKKEKVFNKQAKIASAGKKKLKSGNKDKGKVKTGNRAVDSHAMASTLGGGTAESINIYREERLKEYHKIIRLCTERNIPFTHHVLERALLTPGDKPPSGIRKKIHQPGVDILISSHFADPPPRPKTPIEVKHADKVHRSRTGELLMEAKHTYPQRRHIEPQKTVVNLSTGRAFISNKVNCWLSFEEYEYLTRHLEKRYVVLSGKVDNDAFWPGYMLDKIRLCLDKPDHAIGPATVFQSTAQNKPTNLGYNNNLQSWPASAQYVQYGDITQQKRYTVDPK